MYCRNVRLGRTRFVCHPARSQSPCSSLARLGANRLRRDHHVQLQVGMPEEESAIADNEHTDSEGKRRGGAKNVILECHMAVTKGQPHAIGKLDINSVPRVVRRLCRLPPYRWPVDGFET